MKLKWIFGSLLFLLLNLGQANAGDVIHVKIDGTIHLGTTSILEEAVTQAKSQNAEAILIEMDTPGGLLDSTRDIVKLFLNSDIPFLVFVSPSGSRAGSAGTFITMAGHVAAMAPGTNIGAAHPVTATGKDPEEQGGEHMAKKIENDTVAFIETIAKQRDRNVEWAKKAVLESASITEDKALELNVIDLVARDTKELLEKIDGKEVKLAKETRTLKTKDAKLVPLDIDFALKTKNALANPSIMFLLILVAGLGLYMEFSNPGLIFPASAAAIAIFLLLFATSALPMSFLGLSLIVLAFALLIMEFYIASFGLLTIGGLAAFVMGAFLLFDPAESDVRVPLDMIWGTTIALAIIAGFVGYAITKSFTSKQTAGTEGMVGLTGEVVDPISPEKDGRVFVIGEYWKAKASEPLMVGTKVEIVESQGLEIKVKKKEA